MPAVFFVRIKRPYFYEASDLILSFSAVITMSMTKSRRKQGNSLIFTYWAMRPNKGGIKVLPT